MFTCVHHSDARSTNAPMWLRGQFSLVVSCNSLTEFSSLKMEGSDVIIRQ